MKLPIEERVFVPQLTQNFYEATRTPTLHNYSNQNTCYTARKLGGRFQQAHASMVKEENA